MNKIGIMNNDGTQFIINIKTHVATYTSTYQSIDIYDSQKYGMCMFIDGVIQLSEADHDIYDSLILKNMQKSANNILILGGGDGFVAKKSLAINPNANVTIIELDEHVIHASKKHFNQKIFDNINVKIKNFDAIKFLNSTTKKYDHIVSDLTDTPLTSSSQKKFLDQLSDLLIQSAISDGGISLYAGCDLDTAKYLCGRLDGKLESARIDSFGETCFFIYKNL